MERLKTDIKKDEGDEEYIDVGGDTGTHLPRNEPAIVRAARTRRSTRASSAREAAAAKLAAEAAAEEAAIEQDDVTDSAVVEETLDVGDEQDGYYPAPEDWELEVATDTALVLNARKRRQTQKQDTQDYGPVEFRFDSTQRKKQVIVHNSVEFPGRASEWYFARKNNTTRNETYRCVQCRRYREEAKKKRRTIKEERPEARIIVQDDRFLTDPDHPLGDHICEFENNPRTLLESVWCRRALSKANSELRQHPAKPKLKFEQLLDEIRNGNEYAHLPDNVREKIIDDLSDPKRGFAARRRSFARNNRYAINKANERGEFLEPESDNYGGMMQYICGAEHCRGAFSTSQERQRHRARYHPSIYFIDTPKDLENYEHYRISNNIVDGEELLVADEQIVAGDLKMDYDDEPHTIYASEQLDASQHQFMEQYAEMLNGLRYEVEMAINLEPAARDSLLEHFQTFVESVKKQVRDGQPAWIKEGDAIDGDEEGEAETDVSGTVHVEATDASELDVSTI